MTTARAHAATTETATIRPPTRLVNTLVVSVTALGCAVALAIGVYPGVLSAIAFALVLLGFTALPPR